MSTQLAERPQQQQQQKIGAIAVMASRFNVEPAKLLSTLKNTVFRGASDDELFALVVVANSYGLNPMTKEIYAFPAKGGGIVPVVSIDGWLRIINDHPQMDGMEFEWERDSKGEPISCTAVIYRKDRSHPTKVTEYLSECKRNTEPWKMANRMLRHKAVIQCGRVAFGFGGIYDEDEARDIISRTGPAKPASSAKPVFISAPSNPAPEPDTLDMGPVDAQEVTQAAAPEEPAFTPDTPQRALQIAVSDFGCPEHTFIETFRKQSKKLVGTAQMISELSDEAATAALAEIDMLLTATEEGK
jgi:phage recombination protein Bet